MFDFHKEKQRYFDIQKMVTSEEIIPWMQRKIALSSQTRVLEIGCGEAGVLAAFLELNCDCVGIELSDSRVKSAENFLAPFIEKGKAKIINENIYDIVEHNSIGTFDLIILKDVIEHIPDQERFIGVLPSLLKPNGIVFFAYPPWWMPFGGHQQIAKSKFLRMAVWIHLLPKYLYTFILKAFGESNATIKELEEVKSTGITIDKMYQILSKYHYTIIDEIYWFINPIYKYKFGFQKRKVMQWLTKIPYLRNFYTTAHYIMFTRE